MRAQKNSSFSEAHNLVVAVNGDGLNPWRSNSILDFYPHNGELVTPIGLPVSQGNNDAKGVKDEVTLYISLAQVLNSPVDRGIPGLERQQANHLGIWIQS